jgi:hypothetical protein
VQEYIKLICALAAFICISFGVFALFSGLKADGVVDITALVKGKIKTGSAGIMLLFFGTVLFGMLILKGASDTKRDLTLTDPSAAATNAAVVKLHEETGGRGQNVP